MTSKQNSATNNKIRSEGLGIRGFLPPTSYLLLPTFIKITAALLILIFFSGAAFCQEKINIAVTDMWLTLLTSFIGGQEVNVIPIKIWNSNGDLVIAEKGKILRKLPSDVKIIALDKNDADTIKGLEDFNVCYLYSSFPVEKSLLIDPSVIPFVAQRILTALSEWDTQNYPYYQRRLAEFQARLSGASLAGQVLKDVAVCDMSGSCGILLKAAGCKIEVPESESLEKWKKGNFAGLRDYLDDMKAKNITIVFDDDIPPVLRKYLSGRSEAFHWKRPAPEVDYPTFLNEQYISLWQKTIAKPLT
ncbi:MAG: hypothetical protein IJT20_01135 [Synergistaceae bacterium]|nr:hypothetical protein [Synergistaceae bacterium]